MKRGSLLHRIRWLFVGVLLGLGATVAAGLWFLTRDALEKRLESDVASVVNQLDQALRQRRSILQSQSRLIADQQDLRIILINPETQNDQATIRSALAFHCTRIEAEGAAYGDRDGRIRAATGLGETIDYALPPSELDRMADDPDYRRVDLIRGEHGFLLASTTPVRLGESVLGSVTTFSLVGDSMARDLAKTLEAEVAFVMNGQVVARSNPNLALPPKMGPSAETLDTPDGAYSGRVVAMTRVDPRTAASVAVFRSNEEAVANFRNMLWMFLGILAAAIGGASILAGRFARGIVRPLDEVVAAAVEMEEGRWPEPLGVATRDEVGLLRGVFNEMVQSLRDSQQRLLAMVDSDPLTGLVNHRRFKESLSHEVARRTESGDPLSVVVLDLDEFKRFNERFGLGEGDAALCRVARAILEGAPEFATCARFGGEEFAILLPLYDLEKAEELAEALRRAVELLAGEPERGMTVSAGCAQLGTNTAEPEGLVVAAELALWRAKQLGRNRVCRFDSIPSGDVAADPYRLYQFYQDASLSTIQALAAAVDAKDSYTQGHSQRVAEYARDLARRLGRSETECDLIYRTGTLHDVGKIGVPDSILKKPGRLEEEERQIMETHPVLGEEIVKKVPQLADTLPGVRHHHERWDGKGYPDGLAGEAIPSMARALALADTYDAMTSDRPYRKGMDVEVALGIIEKESGAQFDPDMAPAFVAMMRERAVPKAA